MFEIERRREELLVELERLENKARQLERFGEDDYENGAVITFSVRFPDGGISYHYAAVKADERWWLTGKSQHPMSWDRLVTLYLIRSDDAAYVTDVMPL